MTVSNFYQWFNDRASLHYPAETSPSPPLQYKAEDVPRHVLFIHADPKPAISQEFKGTFTESETDLADKAAAQAAQETVQLRGELERVKAELEKAQAAGAEQKPARDAVAARLGNEETRRRLLPTPLMIKSPAEKEQRWGKSNDGFRACIFLILKFC